MTELIRREDNLPLKPDRRYYLTTRKIMKLAVLVILMLFRHTWAQSKFKRCPEECDCYPDPDTGNGVIDCSNRNITTVPDIWYPHFPRGGFIAKVDFSNNKLTILDITQVYKYIKGTKVFELDFSHNQISEVVGNFGAKIGYKTLNLSYNAFTEFPINVVPITHDRSALILDFSYNQLAELPARMFGNNRDRALYQVQFLARGNLISRIDNEAFQDAKLTELVLDLRFNQLTNLSRLFRLEPPTYVKKLLLSGNPWNCDCNLRWIIAPDRYFVNYTASDPPSCEEPDNLKGRSIFNLTLNEFVCAPYLEGSRVIDIVDQEFTLTCPVSADPPNTLKITWAVWFPIPGQAPVRVDVTSTTFTSRSSFRSAFRCTASNTAGSVTIDLDVRYNGVPGIAIPEGE